ncbi:MAG TPA: tagaturonate epimerase family protein [Planctomycetota bacterium]|nr:tagaturonate epimerase family protein [Planctomycetota bacterium]
MLELQLLLVTEGLAPRLKTPSRLAGELSLACDMEVCPRSVAGHDRVIYFLARSRYDKHLGLVYDALAVPPSAQDFEGTPETYEVQGVRVTVKLCPRSTANAAALRARLPFLAPQCMGLATSVGLGDRLGLATPGHVRAVAGSGLRAFFAQQSIREMTRTGRTPQQVLDDAMWGVFQEGFREGFGADADHLKTTKDIDACSAAGFTLFTIDPGQHVDDAADAAPAAELAEKFRALRWDDLETAPADRLAAYAGKRLAVADGLVLEPTETDVLRAAAKYGAAIAQTVRLYRHLATVRAGRPFELEMSVDETASATSPFEHYFVAAELRRLGVAWVSLAPRFVGRFEKGVDYIGDLAAFEQSFAQHAAIARALGPYKLSIHSGSDKFSIYPIAARLAGELIHVKTAGTSYLEALRAGASVAPELFRAILDFACEHYEEDRASYHVSADVAKVPRVAHLKDSELPAVLEQFDAREVLHVTYGSVLNARARNGAWRFREGLFEAIRQNEAVYSRMLERHLGRHVAPFRKG